MAKHGFTPGPWSYRSQPHDDWGVVRAGRFWICQAKDPRAFDDETLAAHRAAKTDPWEANARLIAASPTLLEALEQLLKDVDDLMGSSEGVAGLHHNGDLAPWSELAEGGQFSDWIGHATAKARAAITLATGKDA